MEFAGAGWRALRLARAGLCAIGSARSFLALSLTSAFVCRSSYLRSTPSAKFNLKAGDYNVPIGAGVGKVALVGSSVVNFFLEPQYTFLSHGAGQPLFQLFAGINTQFKL